LQSEPSEKHKQGRKKYFNAAHAAPNYKVGDFLLLNNARRNTQKGEIICPRWSTKPYAIEEVMAKSVFRLQGRKQLTNAHKITPYKCAKRPAAQVPKQLYRDDCELMASYQSDSLDFTPVNAEWQTYRTSILGLTVYRMLQPEAPKSFVSILDAPAVTVDMRGDGNCVSSV